MKEVADCLGNLRLDAPQAHLNLALYPLVSDEDAPARYVLLDEALERHLARVTEVSGAGSVPELAFENSSAEKILLVDGDELVGAKQNRIVNLSILVGAGKRIVIPVTCVEQGRWRYQSETFTSSKSSLFSKARARKMEHVSASLRQTGSRRSDQGEIWAKVAEKADSLGVRSETMAMHDVVDAYGPDLERHTRAFRVVPHQRGAVVAIDGKIVGMELFDSSVAFARYFEKFVRGYAIDALETQNGKHLAASEEEVRRFLASLSSTNAERFAALGEGEDVRLSGPGIAGGALAIDGHLVHLAGYVVA